MYVPHQMRSFVSIILRLDVQQLSANKICVVRKIRKLLAVNGQDSEFFYYSIKPWFLVGNVQMFLKKFVISLLEWDAVSSDNA